MWYFGDHAGLDFNSGTPLTLGNSEMDSNEGSASIADANGNLLFYTDGMIIWDASHDTMSNGAGLNGNSQSTQSALIVPKPGSTTLYYVFTTDAVENLLVNGLQYSIVDITLNGGLGAVTSKNNLLQTPMVEKLTAVQDSITLNFWIVGHKWNSNEFYAYQITSAGLNTTPVITAIGLTHTGGTQNQNAVGYMKFSPDGSKIAVAINEMDRIELFDFNISTGVLSNTITFPTIYNEVYGLEFSPDGSRLYVSTISPPRIYQVNLNAGSSAAIIASSTLIATSAAQFIGTLQIGPDANIYVARYVTTSLGVINDPDALGAACNYVDLGLSLISGYSIFGLPNFIQNLFNDITTVPENNFQNPNINVFPNPTSNGKFSIELNSLKTDAHVEISVYDVWGRIIFSENPESYALRSDYLIDLKMPSDGLYKIVVNDHSEVYSKNVVVSGN